MTHISETDPDVARIEAEYARGDINLWEYRKALIALYSERENLPRPLKPVCRMVDENNNVLDFDRGLER